MIRTQISKKDLKTIKAFQTEKRANLGTIKNLSLANDDINIKIFNIACNGDTSLIEDAVIAGDQLISFKTKEDRIKFSVDGLREQLLKEGNYEFAARLRDLEAEFDCNKSVKKPKV